MTLTILDAFVLNFQYILDFNVSSGAGTVDPVGPPSRLPGILLETRGDILLEDGNRLLLE